MCHTLSPGGVGQADQQFLYVQYLIVINIASVNLKIIKPKYPVACSRSVGAAGERDLLWSMLLCVADQLVNCACLARLPL